MMVAEWDSQSHGNKTSTLKFMEHQWSTPWTTTCQTSIGFNYLFSKSFSE